MNLVDYNPYGNGLLYCGFNQDQGKKKLKCRPNKLVITKTFCLFVTICILLFVDIVNAGKLIINAMFYRRRTARYLQFDYLPVYRIFCKQIHYQSC